ncbi:MULTISPECIES: FecCD family ABC transporter permease [unclassified Frigoribacterium]|uniref:FecCD family ABC transporter permease n=2 Tax=Frigoribacterium TaxID=96492 RepID=UPI000F4A432F|nr:MULTISPECIES: iron chelate uptake ABC transporter family permease subunit [unclassified Frigoribacterium]ROS53780.1 iron complex transport system permease protein [Frigoribacterium sp. PhB118]WAC51918.1 iron chelate uptake ABC transporter family permease subunit [Frigoribacterium sp. SL97]
MAMPRALTVGRAPRPTRGSRRTRTRLLALVAALALLALAVVLGLAVGARPVAFDEVLRILTGAASRDTADATAVLDLRLPRTVAAIVAGAGLGVAGAVVQAVTRNPLADPGILGVTSGSAFAVALAVGFAGVTSASGWVWFSFVGAGLATVAVALIGGAGRGGGGPARLTLAGLALGSVLAGITSSIVLADPRRFDAVRAWEVGSLADRGWEPVLTVLPFVAAGVVVALIASRPLDAVALGDEHAASVGVSVPAVRVVSLVVVTLLAGGATAVVGPIAFVGLMVAHAARGVVGPSQPWITALSAVLGPVLLLLADVLGRVVAPPGELAAGLVTAAVGAPVLIAIARRRRVGGA